MATLIWLILFLFIASFTVITCSAHLSDFVKEFRFIKCDNQSDEFDFSSLAGDNEDNGETYSGKTVRIHESSFDFYFLRDNNDTLYWTVFDANELEQTNGFTKSVRIVEQRDNELRFNDDFYNYKIDLAEGILDAIPYDTEWNARNICFTKIDAENNTFEFKILSDNNSRTYNGTTYIENEDDPYVQHFDLDDPPHNFIYEIDFTENELHSNEIFCKDDSRIFDYSFSKSSFAHQSQNIDPNALKSLIG